MPPWGSVRGELLREAKFHHHKKSGFESRRRQIIFFQNFIFIFYLFYFLFFIFYSLFLILQLNVVCECPLVSYCSSAIFIGVKSFHHCNCAPAWFSASLMVARVKEVGAVHTKSLFRSPAVGDFYGTWIKIWAGFGLNGQLSCLHSFNQYIKLCHFQNGK